MLRNPHRPWLALEASRTSGNAHAVTQALFGARAHIDDAGDAFRHGYASAMLTVAARNHGLDGARASTLTVASGLAHERDGACNPQVLSRVMDEFNNPVGARIGATIDITPGGRLGDMSDALQRAVLDAMEAGELRVIEGDQLVATAAHHLPPVPA